MEQGIKIFDLKLIRNELSLVENEMHALQLKQMHYTKKLLKQIIEIFPIVWMIKCNYNQCDEEKSINFKEVFSSKEYAVEEIQRLQRLQKISDIPDLNFKCKPVESINVSEESLINYFDQDVYIYHYFPDIHKY